jgi:hypothetical protein
VWTDWSGAVTIGIPPNDNGFGYVCYSRNGYGQAFSLAPTRTTQAFEGAADLDIGPAVNGASVQAGRIWCAAGSRVEALLSADTGGWGAGAAIEVDLLERNGSVIATARHAAGTGHTTFVATAPAAGWLTAQVRGVGLPASGAPFTLTMTYMATSELDAR